MTISKGYIFYFIEAILSRFSNPTAPLHLTCDKVHTGDNDKVHTGDNDKVHTESEATYK